MADLLKSLSYAASGMEAQSARLRHVAENISNADTPGYHRKLVAFDENMADGTVQAGQVVLDKTPLTGSMIREILWPMRLATMTARMSIWWSKWRTRAKRSVVMRRTSKSLIRQGR